MPENFYDITSSMLLTQPEPQYLYAQMFKSALSMSLSVPGELGLPGRSIGGNGAAYSSEQRDRLMLSDQVNGGVFATTVNFSGMAGSTIRINRPVFTDSTYTAASRLIATGTTISTTPITPSAQQNNLTLFRYGGPYDNTGAAVQPYGIEAFDASMGVHKAASIVGTHMKRDFDKFLDAVWVTLFDLAATAVYPEGMSAVNDATTAGMFPFTFEQLGRTERLMDDANLPTFADGFRLMVLTPVQVEQLGLDGNYNARAKYHEKYSSIFPNYVASVKKFHILKSTTLSRTANSSSVAIQYGHALAPGVAMGGMGRPPRVAANTNDNYGESVLAIWLADLAFALANNSFVYSVRSSA
ncbi:MAG TPA: hypothetical protein VGK73_11335 [Polyangiaceae bacterium]